MFKYFILLSFAAALSVAPVYGTNADEAQKTLREGVVLEATTQQRLDQWAGERADLLFEIRDLNIKTSWLAYQQEKYRNYLEKQQRVVAELKRRKEEARAIRMGLEPVLDEMVTNLELFIASDLPFLPEERANRVAFLKETLNDYHLDLSEKLRRVLEALQVEAEYGKTIEKREMVLDIDGRQTRVVVMRIGRTALFYRSVDGLQVGRWNRTSSLWESLPIEFGDALGSASEMAAGKRSVELLTLPVGKYETTEIIQGN